MVDVAGRPDHAGPVPTHQELILQQFTSNANSFATAPPITNQRALDLLLTLSAATKDDIVLDVACGAGVVVCAFGPVVKHARGIDLVPAMIERAEALATEKGLTNVSFQVGDVLPLPFGDNSFSIVTSRYAFHHIKDPPRVLQEMARVCKQGGRLVLADMAASEQPGKAAALNRMEKLRDPSHVRSLTGSELQALFLQLGLTPSQPAFYRLPFDLDSVLKGSNPLPGDEIKVRQMFESCLKADEMDLEVRQEDDGLHFAYNIAVIVACKE